MCPNDRIYQEKRKKMEVVVLRLSFFSFVYGLPCKLLFAVFFKEIFYLIGQYINMINIICNYVYTSSKYIIFDSLFPYSCYKCL